MSFIMIISITSAAVQEKFFPSVVITTYMVVRIDISSLPGHLRKVIMKEIGFKHRSEKSTQLAAVVNH